MGVDDGLGGLPAAGGDRDNGGVGAVDEVHDGLRVGQGEGDVLRGALSVTARARGGDDLVPAAGGLSDGGSADHSGSSDDGDLHDFLQVGGAGLRRVRRVPATSR